MVEAVHTSETSVDNHSTWQYNPEDSSEHHTCRRENLKSHMFMSCLSLSHISFWVLSVRSWGTLSYWRTHSITVHDWGGFQLFLQGYSTYMDGVIVPTGILNLHD
jgi:hypothetical protein